MEPQDNLLHPPNWNQNQKDQKKKERQQQKQKEKELKKKITRPFFGYSRIVAFEPSGWQYKPNNSYGNRGRSYQQQQQSSSSSSSQQSIPTARFKVSISQWGNVCTYGIPYSEHSSFPELVQFIQDLNNPRIIIPTVVSLDNGPGSFNKGSQTQIKLEKKASNKNDEAERLVNILRRALRDKEDGQRMIRWQQDQVKKTANMNDGQIGDTQNGSLSGIGIHSFGNQRMNKTLNLKNTTKQKENKNPLINSSSKSQTQPINSGSDHKRQMNILELLHPNPKKQEVNQQQQQQLNINQGRISLPHQHQQEPNTNNQNYNQFQSSSSFQYPQHPFKTSSSSYSDTFDQDRFYYDPKNNRTQQQTQNSPFLFKRSQMSSLLLEGKQEASNYQKSKINQNGNNQNEINNDKYKCEEVKEPLWEFIPGWKDNNEFEDVSKKINIQEQQEQYEDDQIKEKQEQIQMPTMFVARSLIQKSGIMDTPPFKERDINQMMNSDNEESSDKSDNSIPQDLSPPSISMNTLKVNVSSLSDSQSDSQLQFSLPIQRNHSPIDPSSLSPPIQTFTDTRSDSLISSQILSESQNNSSYSSYSSSSSSNTQLSQSMKVQQSSSVPDIDDETLKLLGLTPHEIALQRHLYHQARTIGSRSGGQSSNSQSSIGRFSLKRRK
ncbi:MAG: hypothetical protein EZS28_012382 [Streblomastix strix]|uniref:DNA repair metallo-beta-lactamase domain-containing protein n=1 Tax=Streblomastix strix TaxID=222440 RepID=A0A5J4WAU7_9EUKA|nr:MAG: hypothetical protein EZS28_012382 [Streblomastix strix]